MAVYGRKMFNFDRLLLKIISTWPSNIVIMGDFNVGLTKRKRTFVENIMTVLPDMCQKMLKNQQGIVLLL